jgi:hypothetical protein
LKRHTTSQFIGANFVPVLRAFQANETLFLVSCSERLIESGEPYCIQEIFNRIRNDLKDTAARYVKFRLVLVHREADALQRQVMFVSSSMRLFGGEPP